jgi:hypothetical protein
MENSTKGDPRGDVIARGIVSEELARVMYERYVKLISRNLEFFLGFTRLI